MVEVFLPQTARRGWAALGLGRGHRLLHIATRPSSAGPWHMPGKKASYLKRALAYLLAVILQALERAVFWYGLGGTMNDSAAGPQPYGSAAHGAFWRGVPGTAVFAMLWESKLICSAAPMMGEGPPPKPPTGWKPRLIY
jgi:hypothetical protein